MADQVRIASIKTELETDSLGLGYTVKATYDAADAATQESLSIADRDLMNLANRVVVKSIVSGADAFKATVDTEYDLLSPEARQEWLNICAIDELEPINGKPAASTVIRLFGGGSATVTALQALREDTVGRGVEIGVNDVSVGDIQNARAL